MPENDSIIQEVRNIRHQIAEKCENDIRKISDHADKAYMAFLIRTRLIKPNEVYQ